MKSCRKCEDSNSDQKIKSFCEYLNSVKETLIK